MAALVTVISAALPHGARAAHPLLTEDTATQGERVVELENAFVWSRSGAADDFTYEPQISVGLTQALDLIVQPSWLRSRAAGTVVRGSGDTNVDLKWRVREADPWSYALRSGLTLPTNQNGLGLPERRTGLHALFAASWAVAPFWVHSNLALVHLPDGTGRRATSLHVSAAAVWRASEEWALVTEAGADTATHRGSHAWPATAMVGVVRTLRAGTDVDVGYRVSAGSGATTRTLLVGFTLHFGP